MLKTRRKFYLGCVLAAGQFTSVSGWAVVPAGHEVMPVHVGVSAVHEVMPETRPGATNAVVSQASAAERGVHPTEASVARLSMDSAARLGADSAAHPGVDSTAHLSVDGAARLSVDSTAHSGVDSAARLGAGSVAHPGVDSTAHLSVDGAARLSVDSTAHPGVDSAARLSADSVRSSQENRASSNPLSSLPVRPADAALGKAAPHASLLDTPDHEMTAVAVHTTPRNEPHSPVSHDPVSGDSQQIQQNSQQANASSPRSDVKRSGTPIRGKFIGSGESGSVYVDTQRPGYVVKSYHFGMDLASAQKESEDFNMYHGSGASFVVSNSSNSNHFIIMKHIPGVPLKEIYKTSQLAPDADKALNNMFDRISQSNIKPVDMNFGNILYDKETNTFSPVDITSMHIEYESNATIKRIVDNELRITKEAAFERIAWPEASAPFEETVRWYRDLGLNPNAEHSKETLRNILRK